MGLADEDADDDDDVAAAWFRGCDVNEVDMAPNGEGGIVCPNNDEVVCDG